MAPRHQVVHLAPVAAEPLFRREPNAKGYHVTCMIRCDAFRGNQSRGQGIPSPTEVYDVVNKVTADFLADGPRWETPSLADTRRAARELARAPGAEGAARPRKKLKA